MMAGDDVTAGFIPAMVERLPVIAWIIESKVGPWMTKDPEIAAKHRAKSGSVVTEYRSLLP